LTTERNREEKPALIRGIGAIGVALLVLNSMIGSGIFALPGLVAVQAGELSPWLFLAIGILFITVVLSFAELAGYFRESGGPVLYTTTAFGPLVGFSTGWIFYTSRMTAFAANATAMAVYLGAIWPWIASDTGRALFITTICVGLTFANYFGVKDGIRTVAIFTFLKLTPLLILTLLGLKEVTGETLLPGSFPTVDDFGGLTLLIIYAFVGFEAATIVSGETKNPRRTLPRSLVTTVVAIAILYFLIMLVYISVLAEDQRADTTLVDVGRQLAGDWGALAIGLAAVFSIGGNLAANMLSVPRLTFALGELRMLPRWFAAIHPKFSTPGNSVLLLGGLSLVFALSGSFAFLAAASSLTRLIAYSLCIGALPFIRRNASATDKANGFMLKGGYSIPLIAISLCIWIAAQSSLRAWQITGTMLVLGLFLYWLAQKRVHRGNY